MASTNGSRTPVGTGSGSGSGAMYMDGVGMGASAEFSGDRVREGIGDAASIAENKNEFRIGLA